ncbi:hypothetical protein ABT304_26960 [Nocardioides sp. NPDC000445]|uniref:hypothetical protein n=1 Tax=Nocardioides sp. NPDC000445 TaxID=3154257 RepID=UPI00331DE027
MSTDHPDYALHAWVDESIHVSAGFYMIAAAIADVAQIESHRDFVRAIAPSPRRRIHWREEEDKDRLRIAEAFGQLDLAHTVVVASPIDPRKQERARRKCFERLLPELAGIGVTHAWLETRTTVLNGRDRAMVAAMRGSGALTGSLRVEFGDPEIEPLLWIPDVIAGALGAARRGLPRYRDALAIAIDEIEVCL